jgi:hypothetical protein
MKCEFHHRSSSKDNERSNRVCICAKQFFEYAEDGSVRQTNYIPLKLLVAKCSKCGQRDASTLKIGIDERNYICCNCQGDLHFKDRMYIKTTGSSLFKKIKKRHHGERTNNSDKYENSHSSPSDPLSYLRNSQEALKSMDVPTIAIDFKPLTTSNLAPSSPQQRKNKKLLKKTSYVQEFEQENVRKVFFTKYNPFEKLKKMYQENEPVVAVSQAFDWHNFCVTYHKTKKEVLKKMHESLINCCKIIWSDIDGVIVKNPQFVIDFENLDICLKKYLKFGFTVDGSPYFGIASLDGQVQKIQTSPNFNEAVTQEDHHSQLFIEDLMDVSKPDLEYLALAGQHLKEGYGKIDYQRFLNEFSHKNRQRLMVLFNGIEDNFQSVIDHEKQLRRDEKFTLKISNFLAFMKFLKRYQQIYSKYARVKDELANYLSFITTGKYQQPKIENEPKDIPQTPEPRPIAKIIQPLLRPFGLTGEPPGIDLAFLAIMDEVTSPYGFGGLTHHKTSEPATPIIRNTSFVPFQPVNPDTTPSTPLFVSTPAPRQNIGMEIERSDEEPRADRNALLLNETKKTSIKTHHNPREDGSVHELVKHDHDIESDCCICFFSETSYSHPVIYCSGCEQGAHLTCLNMREIPTDNYYCLTCQNKNDDRAPSCYICKNRGFMLLQVSAGDKTFAYHMICVFATKSWSEVYDQQKCSKLKNKSKTRCQYCDKLNLKNNKMMRCATCKTTSFHSLCAFFNGLFFDISFGSEMTYDNFCNRLYDYNADVFCEQCSTERLGLVASEKTPLDVVYMNGYLRLISVWPKFFNHVPTFEKYKAMRIKDCKFWSKI